MSLNLLFIMTGFLLADYMVGLLHGIWNEGFDKGKCIKGAQRYFLIFAGYGALALIAHLSSYRFEEMKYLSGLLLEPIARHFVRLIDRLKSLFSVEQENLKAIQSENQKMMEQLPETVVTVEAVPAQVIVPDEEAKPAEVVPVRKKASPRRRTQSSDENKKTSKSPESAESKSAT